MSVNARESLLQGTRLFVMAATGLAAGKVLVDSGADLVRPALPYATVRALMQSAAVGTDELRHDLGGTDGAQRQWVRGHRRATVQVTLFGTEAADYAEAIRMAAESPATRATTTTGTYAVAIAGVATPRSALVQLGTGFEERVVIDLEVAYRLETAPAEIDSAEHLGFVMTYDGTVEPEFAVHLADPAALTCGQVDSGAGYPWNATVASSLTVASDLGTVGLNISGSAAQLAPTSLLPWNLSSALAGMTVNGRAFSPVAWDPAYKLPTPTAVQPYAVAAYLQQLFPGIRVINPLSTTGLRVQTERLGSSASLLWTGSSGLFTAGPVFGGGNVPATDAVVPAQLAAVASGWSALLATIGVTISVAPDGRLRLTRSAAGPTHWVQVGASSLTTLMGFDTLRHAGT